MKAQGYQKRFYRDWMKREDLRFAEIVVEETDVLISADKKINEKKIKEQLVKYRNQIKEYALKDKDFLSSLKPIDVKKDAPQIVKDMAEATKIAGVGPMAAVAGAIAQYLGEELLAACEEVIVENGGDIFIKTKIPRKIGVFAGKSLFSKKISLEINPDLTPCGVCCSSGTVGHSLSFGKADAAIIVADSAIIADALATEVCNRVKSKKDLIHALDFAKSIEQVKGVLIILDDMLNVWGQIKLA